MDRSSASGRVGRPPVRRAVVLGAAGLVLLGTMAGCGESRSRREAREGLVEQLTQDGDIPEALARCVVDRFFAERTDEELARFMEDPEATRAELDEFAALTTVCAAELRPATT